MNPKSPVQAEICVAWSCLAGEDLGTLWDHSWTGVSSDHGMLIASWAASMGALSAEIEMWSSHTTQRLSDRTWSTACAIWKKKKRCGQIGKGPNEAQKVVQRAGEAVLWWKTEGGRSFHPWEMKAQGGLSIIFSTWRLATKRTEDVPSQWDTWRRQGAMDSSCTRTGSILISAQNFSEWEQPMTGTTSPRMWWNIHHWRFSRCDWTGC